MIYLAWSIVVCAAVAGTVRLVETGHPWFALAILVFVGGASATTKGISR